jgi:hypothetical protein
MIKTRLNANSSSNEIKRKNVSITQARLSKIENGDLSIKVNVYKRALKTLGGC